MDRKWVLIILILFCINIARGSPQRHRNSRKKNSSLTIAQRLFCFSRYPRRQPGESVEFFVGRRKHHLQIVNQDTLSYCKELQCRRTKLRNRSGCHARHRQNF